MDADKIRKETKIDLVKKLEEYHKCCLIRPTGFGKTWLLTEMVKSYKRVLYVYPTAAILNTVVDVYYGGEETLTDPDTIELAKNLKSFDHVDMMTYMKVQSLDKIDVQNLPEYDLVVFDEAHVMGAKGASKTIKKMFKRFTNTDFIGATATPNRMDGFDIVGEFFDNVVVFPYTLHDAFQDGLLQKPVYYYCTYNIEDVKKNALADASNQLFEAGLSKETLKRKEIRDLLKSSILHESSIFNMDQIIKTATSKYLPSNYYKFICFFSAIDLMEGQGEQVVGWFKSAYPDYTINILNIHSRTAEGVNNVNELSKLKARDKHIDLIFCVNMVNVGYHVNNLSGILMFRGTQSNIIYIQQLGRALSSGSDKPCIVFDVVDNLHRKALYEMKNSRLKTHYVVKPTPDVLNQLTEVQLLKLADKSLRCRIEKHGDRYIVLSNSEHYSELAQDAVESWWRGANSVESEDLYASGYEATYKELIAKAVAEPISYLCREAVNLHFKRWCRDRNISFPVTRKELKEMYGVPEATWRDEFKEIIENHGLEYPWQDAEKIMTCAAVPLDVFAREKQVSVPRILELLGVA